MLGFVLYMFIGILTHFLVIGMTIDWSSVGSLFVILAWPIIAFMWFLLCAVCAMVVYGMYKVFSALTGYRI